MTKAVKIAAASFVFLLLAAWIAGPALLSGVPAGSESNPLISLDYLDKVISALKGEVNQEISGLQDQIADLQQRLIELEGGTLVGPEPPAEPAVQPLTILVNASTVNFRPQPSTDTTPITKVRLGDKILVDKWQDGWFRGTLADGRVGWIFAELTKPEQNHAPGRITFSTVNVRIGPGTNFDRLADRIHENDLVNIIATQNDWYQVVLADGQQGWVLSSLVEKIE